MAMVKAEIERQEGIPVAEQRLEFNSCQIDNSSTLADCGIHSESTLYQLLRLVGGDEKERR